MISQDSHGHIVNPADSAEVAQLREAYEVAQDRAAVAAKREQAAYAAMTAAEDAADIAAIARSNAESLLDLAWRDLRSAIAAERQAEELAADLEGNAKLPVAAPCYDTSLGQGDCKGWPHKDCTPPTAQIPPVAAVCRCGHTANLHDPDSITCSACLSLHRTATIAGADVPGLCSGWNPTPEAQAAAADLGAGLGLRSVAMCMCEHEQHFDAGRPGHAYGKQVAGDLRAQHVGPVCDYCAVNHLAEYLTNVPGEQADSGYQQPNAQVTQWGAARDYSSNGPCH